MTNNLIFTNAPHAASVLTTKQVAAELGVSARLVEKMRQSGNGPTFTTVGRLVRYRRCDVDNWLTARAKTSTCERLSDVER